MDKFEEIAKRNNLENDNQTRKFAQFLSIASKFASADFNSRLKIIPELVSTIRDHERDQRVQRPRYRSSRHHLFICSSC